MGGIVSKRAKILWAVGAVIVLMVLLPVAAGAATNPQALDGLTEVLKQMIAAYEVYLENVI